MNVLVTGACGQLGREIAGLHVPCGDRYVFSSVHGTEDGRVVPLDITDRESVRRLCRRERVDVIVNCAAYTDVERAESDAAAADLINHRAVANLADTAYDMGALLIHVSTDYVFDGEATIPYKEDAPTHPLNVYGATKLAGELAVAGSGCRHMIFRTQWLYSPFGKNFLLTAMRTMREKPRMRVVSDQTGSPTCAADLAELIVGLIARDDTGHTGVYHYSDEGSCSWYDFALAIRELTGSDCEVLPCSSADYPSKAVRPRYGVLDKTLVRETFGIGIPHWRDSLSRCISRTGIATHG